jgi:uncharacterized protein HemX
VAPEKPVRKPAARVSPKKPLEAAPPAEKSDREKALDSAAAAATEPGAPPAPPAEGVAGSTAPDAAPMVPPLSADETAAGRTETTEETTTQTSLGAGTWVVLAALGLGIAFVIGLTVRRRRAEELSIFERSMTAATAPQPPIVHQS